MARDKCPACGGSGLYPNEVPGVGTEWVGCPGCDWCGHDNGDHQNGCRLGLGPDEHTVEDQCPDALDSLPIAALLHKRLASWFGDDRQSFLVADLVPVVTRIVAEFQCNALEMARRADRAERRAEAAEAEVESLRDALIDHLRAAVTGDGECHHDWLDRPESDTRECLICGTEVSG